MMASYAGVGRENLPCIRILKPSEEGVTNFKYELPIGLLTVESISKFISKFTDS
jgi:hypothetical protein